MNSLLNSFAAFYPSIFVVVLLFVPFTYTNWSIAAVAILMNYINQLNMQRFRAHEAEMGAQMKILVEVIKEQEEKLNANES